VQIQVAVAKIGKYASSQSGDTLEMTERPNGGFSVVLADGQRSGRAAKTISNLVTSKAIALISEGVRDGAVARATHDYLYAVRGGKVSATLNIASVDMVTKTLVLSRNSHCPIVIQLAVGEQRLLDDPAPPIGVHRAVKPQIAELPIQVGMVAVVYTDGIQGAGGHGGEAFDAPALIDALYERYCDDPNMAVPLADDLLAAAVEADHGRPQDDASVLVIAVSPHEVADGVRRLVATYPIPPLLRP
jgi:serine phosphatase RsbU (regulator of sigma subunit)